VAAFVKVFGRRPVTNVFTGTAAGVRKPPRDETAGRGTHWAVPRAQLWGFGGGRVTAEVGGGLGWAVAMALQLRCEASL
jgi:hypothetical protein